MNNQSMSSGLKWTLIGTAAQLAMIVAGHYNEFVKNNVFAIGGMAISLIFGAIYGRTAANKKDAAIGGFVVGGLCALIGIAASVALGDTEAAVLGFGTIGSAVAGLIGGIATKAVSGSKSPARAGQG
jgi:hypothetical protein